jgi:hypothetical protein
VVKEEAEKSRQQLDTTVKRKFEFKVLLNNDHIYIFSICSWHEL